jgi:hypothetical protein
MMKKKKLIGLYKKYLVYKTNGKPIDPKAEFIVLRIDDGQYVDACRVGVAAFAKAVRKKNPILADDIERKLVEFKDFNK